MMPSTLTASKPAAWAYWFRSAWSPRNSDFASPLPVMVDPDFVQSLSAVNSFFMDAR